MRARAPGSTAVPAIHPAALPAGPAPSRRTSARRARGFSGQRFLGPAEIGKEHRRPGGQEPDEGRHQENRHRHETPPDEPGRFLREPPAEALHHVVGERRGAVQTDQQERRRHAEAQTQVDDDQPVAGLLVDRSGVRHPDLQGDPRFAERAGQVAISAQQGHGEAEVRRGERRIEQRGQAEILLRPAVVAVVEGAARLGQVRAGDLGRPPQPLALHEIESRFDDARRLGRVTAPRQRTLLEPKVGQDLARVHPLSERRRFGNARLRRRDRRPSDGRRDRAGVLDERAVRIEDDDLRLLCPRRCRGQSQKEDGETGRGAASNASLHGAGTLDHGRSARGGLTTSSRSSASAG